MGEPIFDNNRATNIQTKEKRKDNAYRANTADEIIAHTNQSHLNPNEKKQLKNILNEFVNIFQGQPGTFTGLEVDFQLKEGVRLFYGRPYLVPEAYTDAFKQI